MRTPIIVSIVVVLAAGAHAATARRPHGELELVRTGHATLTFVFDSQSADDREVVQSIELPVGMTVTALSVAMGDAEPVRSFAFAKLDGRATYDRIVEQIRDPALLEYRGERRASLRVFPVRRGAPATVVLELTATSLVHASQLVHLDAHVSLLAAPQLEAPTVALDRQDYADYWPPHIDAAIVATRDD